MCSIQRRIGLLHGVYGAEHMTTEIPRWMMGDPAKVYERIEAREQASEARAKDTKAAKALDGLRELFGEEVNADDERR